LGTPTSKNSKLLRELFAFALILSIFVQALVPSGWMPARSTADGRITLSICSISGAKTVVVDRNGEIVAGPASEDSSDDQNNHLDQICPFATGNLLALADPLPKSFAFVASTFKRTGLHFDKLTIVAGYAGPPIGSRAPPAA
jgi:hypothetical protein